MAPAVETGHDRHPARPEDEVDQVRKAAHDGAPQAAIDDRILARPFGDTVEVGGHRREKLAAEAGPA